MSGAEHHPQRLAQPALAWRRRMLARHRGAGGLDGVDAVALRAGHALVGGDLDDVLSGLGEERGQPGGEAAGALQRPHPRPGRVRGCPRQHVRIARSVRVVGEMRANPPGAGVHDGQVDRVTFGVAPDDVVVLLCQHDHLRVSLPPGRTRVGAGLGDGHFVAAAL